MMFSDRQLLGLGAAALAGLWWLKGRAVAAYEQADQVAEEWTAPAGQWLSDVTASANGNERVEFTALQLQRHYFDENWQMTAEAYRILMKVYPGELAEILTPGGVLKPQYRGLMGQPITIR